MYEYKSEYMYFGVCGLFGVEVIRVVSNWMLVLGNKIGFFVRELNVYNR